MRNLEIEGQPVASNQLGNGGQQQIGSNWTIEHKQWDVDSPKGADKFRQNMFNMSADSMRINSNLQPHITLIIV